MTSSSDNHKGVSFNESVLVNALSYAFDEQPVCDISFFEDLRSYYTAMPHTDEVEHFAGMIKKYRFAYYAKLQIEQAHTAAWEANKWPNQIVVEFYFNCFISMCRACLDCVAHWLNDVFSLAIPNPIDIDLNKDKFVRLIEQRRPELSRELSLYKGWISKLSKYREIILHRGNVIPIAVGIGPPEAASARHWCSVLADPAKTLADRQWIVERQAAGEFPFIPLNLLCNDYAGNLSAVVRVCVTHGHAALTARESRAP